ncbi:PREDICTED: protein artemis [Dinoponera quadriceps]|uniref:Protein artemis n=1 Tax=Dinoponera quadriceps TaxID=609295 RepID=A0A6P3XFU8_DINQU|nr:PREDICTED: protein artemis [Dinoponera quadriceps]XP_014477285.1 PREDICTED: protein artemis [Dinoponera quadriceps]XP_014477286.1 PREDICTED: protein artemis [Dinoponera quadriceps]XP_014477289.1 PREDICTED: protein artemis [Dinoponera quadriceps]XP_014477290.1 PREDICTED: protein artemis [Dinoponera quadriceps]
MSTFPGLIEEIPGISVDRFDGKNFDSFAYFLSHYHVDHMQGLNYEFFAHLQQCNRYLYCSRISKIFLSSVYPEICIRELDLNERISVEYGDTSGTADILFVTCISAGHCPGSVMFLFERADKSILYTGDFRINSSDFAKIAPLHLHGGFKKPSPRKLTKVYLDTTFLDPDFATFPTRKDSISVMCDVIANWLATGPRNIVILECSANYGPEFLFMELSRFFSKPIHVKRNVYNNYCRIPDLSCHITNDPSTPIHACMSKREARWGLKCRPDVLKKHTLTVVPSTCKWKGKDTSVIGTWDDVRERTFNLCFSMHSSFEELKAFVQYFKPDEIFPCVCPKHLERYIYDLLEEIKRKPEEEKKDVVQEDEKYTLQVLKHKDIDKSWMKDY